MQKTWFYAVWLVGAYLLGSLSAGDLVTRAAGVNIRTLGDGNPGTVNVYREVDPRYGIVVLVLDVATGTAATLPLYFLHVPTWMRLLGVVAVLVGHIFPLFWRFSGGAGGAVGMGATFGLLPLGALIATPVAALALALARTPIFSVWLFFGVTLLAGGMLHRDAIGVVAVLLAMTVPTTKFLFQRRVKSLSGLKKALVYKPRPTR